MKIYDLRFTKLETPYVVSYKYKKRRADLHGLRVTLERTYARCYD
jgi:hypothetical protein